MQRGLEQRLHGSALQAQGSLRQSLREPSHVMQKAGAPVVELREPLDRHHAVVGAVVLGVALRAGVGLDPRFALHRHAERIQNSESPAGGPPVFRSVHHHPNQVWSHAALPDRFSQQSWKLSGLVAADPPGQFARPLLLFLFGARLRRDLEEQASRVASYGRQSAFQKGQQTSPENRPLLRGHVPENLQPRQRIGEGIHELPRKPRMPVFEIQEERLAGIRAEGIVEQIEQRFPIVSGYPQVRKQEIDRDLVSGERSQFQKAANRLPQFRRKLGEASSQWLLEVRGQLFRFEATFDKTPTASGVPGDPARAQQVRHLESQPSRQPVAALTERPAEFVRQRIGLEAPVHRGADLVFLERQQLEALRLR